MKKISAPDHLEFAMFYEGYIGKVDRERSVLDQLRDNAAELLALLKPLSDEQLATPYAEGKWTIKDLLQHMMDTERVFVYRAMRFARNDRSPLPYFDENEFAREAGANRVKGARLLREYRHLRQSTVDFFSNLSAAQLKRTGIASSYTMSVRACAWIICGHELHHLQVIRERYMPVLLNEQITA